MEMAVYFRVLCNTLLVYSTLLARGRFGSNFRHAVCTEVYRNAAATRCAVQQIGIPPLASALSLLGEMGCILNK